jgi:two-component system chemotaxis response regulator CheY
MTKRLLVVDDAKIIREMIKDSARQADWEIVGEGANGQEAIDRYRDLMPDAVTLDMVMPEYDGLHGLRGIMNVDPKAKVLIVSALDQPQILRQAVQLGAMDFMGKPFKKDKLASALDRLVSAS